MCVCVCEWLWWGVRPQLNSERSRTFHTCPSSILPKALLLHWWTFNLRPFCFQPQALMGNPATVIQIHIVQFHVSICGFPVTWNWQCFVLLCITLWDVMDRVSGRSWDGINYDLVCVCVWLLGQVWYDIEGDEVTQSWKQPSVFTLHVSWNEQASSEYLYSGKSHERRIGRETLLYSTTWSRYVVC